MLVASLTEADDLQRYDATLHTRQNISVWHVLRHNADIHAIFLQVRTSYQSIGLPQYITFCQNSLSNP